MDPSLIEIITQAVAGARLAGLSPQGQRKAAEDVLTTMMPGLSPGIARLIVEQLYPCVQDVVIA